MNIDFYLGIALETLLDDGEQTKLKVGNRQVLPFAADDLSEISDIALSVKNLAPHAKEVTGATAAKHITAEYFPLDNGKTRPSIHKDERVLLLDFGGSTDMHWIPLDRDHKRRTRELTRILVSNKDDVENPLTPDNAYVFEVDTREGGKKVRIKTNQNTGESHFYEWLLDTQNGKAHLVDSDGNTLSLDSKKATWLLKNAEGDLFEISPGKVYGKTKSFIMEADSSALIKSPNITLDGEVATTKSVKIAANLNVGGTFNCTASGTFGGPVASAGYTAPGGMWHMP